jgi:hypothetical protein
MGNTILQVVSGIGLLDPEFMFYSDEAWLGLSGYVNS